MGLYGLVDKAVGSPLQLECVWVRGSLQGCAAQVAATLEYTNNTPDSKEAVYIFPWENGVDVCGFQATVEGRTVVAVVKEKKAAINDLDDGIRNGPKDLSLSDNDESSDILEFSIGIVPPQKTVVVLLTYVTELEMTEEGHIVFFLPSALHPKCIPNVSNRGNVARASPRTATVNAKYSFDFVLEVQSASSIREITSPSVPLEVDINVADRRQATVKIEGDYDYSSDIKINVLNSAPFKMHALIENGVTTKSCDRFLAKPVVMVNFCPEFDYQENDGGEFVFLVSRSQNTTGEKIERIREALLLLLASLPSKCHFNVVGFGTYSEKLFPQSQENKEGNREKAHEFAWGMKADLGNADLLQALRDTLPEPIIEGCQRQVVILTDAQINNSDQIIDEVTKSAHTTRCFLLGIDVRDNYVIRRMAKASRGSAENVTSYDRVQPKVSAIMSKACQPVLKDIQVKWNLPSGWIARSIPRDVPPIYRGDRLVAYGLLMREDNDNPQYIIAVEGKAIITAKHENHKDIRHEVKFSALCGNPVDRNTLLHRLAAKRLILQEQGKYDGDLELASDAVKAPIISLSKSANVVSKVTSLVAVDQDTSQPMTPREPTRKRQYQTFVQTPPDQRALGLKPVDMKIPIPEGINGVVEAEAPVFEVETNPEIRSPGSIPFSLSTTRVVGFAHKGSQSSPKSPPQKVMAVSSNIVLSPQETYRGQSSPTFTVRKTVTQPKEFSFAPSEPISPPSNLEEPSSEIIVTAQQVSPQPRKKKSSTEIFVPARRHDISKGPVVVQIPVDPEDAKLVEAEEMNTAPSYDPHARVIEFEVSPTFKRRDEDVVFPDETDESFPPPPPPEDGFPPPPDDGFPLPPPPASSETTESEFFVPDKRQPKTKGPITVQLGIDANDAVFLESQDYDVAGERPSYERNLQYVKPERSPMASRHTPQASDDFRERPSYERNLEYVRPERPPTASRQPAQGYDDFNERPSYERNLDYVKPERAPMANRQPAFTSSEPDDRGYPSVVTRASPVRSEASIPSRPVYKSFEPSDRGIPPPSPPAKGRGVDGPSVPCPQAAPVILPHRRRSSGAQTSPPYNTAIAPIMYPPAETYGTPPNVDEPVPRTYQDVTRTAPESVTSRPPPRKIPPPPPPKRKPSPTRSARSPGSGSPPGGPPQYSPPSPVNQAQRDEEPPPPKPKGLLSSQRELLALQDPSGGWPLNSRLANVCGTTITELRKACPHGGGVTMETAWATALALGCLHLKFGFSKEEWQLRADKGCRWLQANLPIDNTGYMDILERADEMLRITLMYE